MSLKDLNLNVTDGLQRNDTHLCRSYEAPGTRQVMVNRKGC